MTQPPGGRCTHFAAGPGASRPPRSIAFHGRGPQLSDNYTISCIDNQGTNRRRQGAPLRGAAGVSLAAMGVTVSNRQFIIAPDGDGGVSSKRMLPTIKKRFLFGFKEPAQ